MFKFALFLVCLTIIEGRNIQRGIRDVDVNTTTINDTNTTVTKENDPPEISDMQSDLVAPASGPKPLQAKYTIRVKPKLKDGVPQVQEIRIMPPKNNATKGFAKPLMVLKQNVTKPLIENIEIDVPEKGKQYSTKPSVEVVEGDHREMLQVTKGQATVENADQKSETKPADQETKATVGSTSANSTERATPQNTTQSSQNATHQPTTQNATQSSTSQNSTQASTSQPSPSQDAAKPSTSQEESAKNAAASVLTTTTSQSTASRTQPASQPQTPTQAPTPAPADAQPAAPAAPAVAAYNTASVPQSCTDDGRCIIYPEDRCGEQWLLTNCRLKCKLCSK